MPDTLPAWQPPPDYAPVDSAVPGISVFAPRPKRAPEPDAPKSFKCPQCGAVTRYDVAAGGVACEHCGYTTAAQAQQVGLRAQSMEFTLETLSKSEMGWGVARKELHCNSCGADMAIAENALTATCPFCASNRVNVRVAPDDQLRPRFLIPFKIKPQDTRSLAQKWLGQGWYHPDALGASAIVDRFTGIYLPFWTFSAHITSDWKAEVGYEKQEDYYDSDSKSWKTRTVIDWKWESGRVHVQATDLLVCGSTRVSRVIINRLNRFDLTALVNYAPDFLAGWQAQTYDLTLPKAWDLGKAEMRERAKSACYSDTGSSHVRNFSMAADFGDESWRYVLLPVYVAAYQFEGKVYQVMVNGQTGEVAGQKPVAWWKIWLAIAAMLLPGICVGLISLPLLLAGGIGIVPLIAAIVFLILGFVGAFNLHRSAVDSEAS